MIVSRWANVALRFPRLQFQPQVNAEEPKHSFQESAQ